MSTDPVAFYKIRPTHTLPCRPGPVQCIRNCTNCILRYDEHLDADEENIIALKSYDDLVVRNFIWFPAYRSIMYHLGQVAVVKNALRWLDAHLVLYIVAGTQFEDIDYVKMVFSQEKMPSNIEIIDKSLISQANSNQNERVTRILPISLPSCPVRIKKDVDKMLNSEQFSAFLKPLVNGIKAGNGVRLTVVPVVISKDHELPSTSRILSGVHGSLCVQILEPYSVDQYISHLHFEEPTSHFVRHIYHDLSRHAARLPSHLVAFIMLHLHRDECGVSHEDLINYIEWMRKNSLEFDLQVAFSGPTKIVVDLAIEILRRYIHIDAKNKIYRPIDVNSLFDYASTLAPNFALFGVICRAILRLYNSEPKNSFRIYFDPDIQIRVLKDDVIELSVQLAEKLDKLVPCRRPCTTVSTNIVDAFTKMQTLGKYFKIQEPKMRRNTGKPWCGDYDSDEEYYWSKKDDPAFKSWLVLTQRPHRLDRLNLFMNSIDVYFS